MASRRAFIGALAAGCALLAGCAAPVRSADPLPSWNDGAARQTIVAFVAKVTREGTAGYVPPAERIAVFDNDGTLWSEQPVYVQLAFIEFPLQMIMTQAFARNSAGAADLEYWLQHTAALYGAHGRPVYFLDNHDMSRFLAWAGNRGHERLLAALGFMASLSSPIVIFYGTETGISGGRAEPGFNDSGRIPMPWNALDGKLTGQVATVLRLRAELPAVTRGGRLPVYSDDKVLVMRKTHPSGDVLVAVNLAEFERHRAQPFVHAAADAGSAARHPSQRGAAGRWGCRWSCRSLQRRLPAGAATVTPWAGPTIA